MSRAEGAGFVLVLLSLLGCDQLGNPEQLTTGPTVWSEAGHELVTTTHSFRNQKTIRRLVSEGLEGFDHTDPSIGPEQTLTFVSVAPRTLRPVVPDAMRLVTEFEFQGRRAIRRSWSVPARSRQWTAAFALPAAPVEAVTVVAP